MKVSPKNERNSSYSEPKEINKSENTKNTEETQEIIRLSVDLGNNELDHIHVFKNSQPEKLAYYFCIRNKLDYECLQHLIDQIKSSINIYKNASGDLKALSISDLAETPEISPKLLNKPLDIQPQIQLSNVFNSHQSATKKSVNKYNKLLTSYEVKPALFSTETYIPTHSSPKKAKPNIRLNQSLSSNNKKTIHTQEQKLSKDLKSSASQSKMNKQTRLFSPISNSSTPGKSTRCPLNFGERLYHKGLKIQERTKDKLSIIQKQMSQTNISSHKPMTNMISYSTLSKRLINNKNYNNEKVILGYQEYVNNKIEKLKEKYKPKEQYSFSPELNHKSISIVNTQEKIKDKVNKSNNKAKHNNGQRYESLYEKYKSQQLNLEKLSNKIYNKEKLFKPSVNQYECAYTSMSFHDRQGYFKTKSIEKQNTSKQKMEINKDKETGQAYFKPEINDCYQRLENRNIFNDLYYDHNRHLQKKKALEELYNTDYRISQSNTHINQQSNEIFEGLKEKTFKAIFKVLDKDKDGMINQRNIQLDALPKNINHIIQPILNDLRKEDRTLSKEEFVANCFQLFDSISYTEKKEMISFIHKKKINNPINFSFKPAINVFYSSSCKDIKNSLTLSSKCTRSNNAKSNQKMITEILLNQPKETRFSIEEERTQEEKNENEENQSVAINEQ